MHLKYAGPKPIITHKSISFKDGKEDKYVYLASAIDILESMDTDYKNTGHYNHSITEETLSDEQMQDVIIKHNPNLQDLMNKEIEDYNTHLQEEIALVQERKILNDIEKETLTKNLQLMLDYRLQRAKNKIFYRFIITTISNFIKAKKIKEICTPFNERFWHILQTISGEIAINKNSVYSDLKVENQDDNLMAKLIIEN